LVPNAAPERNFVEAKRKQNFLPGASEKEKVYFLSRTGMIFTQKQNNQGLS
jgi:hypothetical protein